LPYLSDVPTFEQQYAWQRCATPPCELQILTDPKTIHEIRALVADATAEQLADDAVASELFAWTRFSPRDPRWYRDGLNAACMGWKGIERLATRVVLAPRTLQLLSRWGLLKKLCGNVDQQAPRAPALCLLSIEGEGTRPRIEAGRCLQRIWLTAAVQGLVTHPLSAAVDVPRTRPRVFELMSVSPGRLHVNLFRIGRSAPPARSARLPADEILEPLAIRDSGA
jgi:hypothetical protein